MVAAMVVVAVAVVVVAWVVRLTGVRVGGVGVGLGLGVFRVAAVDPALIAEEVLRVLRRRALCAVRTRPRVASLPACTNCYLAAVAWLQETWLGMAGEAR